MTGFWHKASMRPPIGFVPGNGCAKTCPVGDGFGSVKRTRGPRRDREDDQAIRVPAEGSDLLFISAQRIPAIYGANDLIPDQTYTDNDSGRCVAALEKVGIPDSQAPPNAQTHAISPEIARKTRPKPSDYVGPQSQSRRSGRFNPSDCAGLLGPPFHAQYVHLTLKSPVFFQVDWSLWRFVGHPNQ